MTPVPTTTEVDRAFPTSSALGELPEVPDKFEPTAKWRLLFRSLFYSPKQICTGSIRLVAHKGVLAENAWRALEVLLGVRDIKHERKEALWPYLASEWFEDGRWELVSGETIAFDDTELETEWVIRKRPDK